MKNYISIFIILLMLPTLTSAVGTVVDPTTTPTWTINCTYPIQREDGTPLALNEIARVDFHVSQDNINYTPAGSNNTACVQVYDLTNIVDGQYYYTATTVDLDGRESSLYSPAVPLLVKRLTPPAAMRSMTGAASK